MSDAPDRSGPSPEFLLLLTSHQSTLYAAISAMLGGVHGAQVVLQETNVALLEKAGEFDAARLFVPWAVSFARFQVLAWRKRQARDRLVLDDELFAAIADRLVAAGLGVYFVLSSQPARATPGPVDQLIDWNIDLTQAQSPDERARIHSERAIALQGKLDRAKLPTQERELAKTLMENGNWLAEHSDPVAESSRFSDIADMMLAQMESATNANDARQVARLTDGYCRIAKLGIEANIERELESGAADDERKERLGRCMKRDADRAEKLTSLAERSPDECRKHFRRASKSSSKYGKRNRDSEHRDTENRNAEP